MVPQRGRGGLLRRCAPARELACATSALIPPGLQAGSYEEEHAMPDIDSTTGMLSLPWWAAATILGSVFVLAVFAFMRNGVGRMLAGFAGFGVIALALGFVWSWQERLAAGDRVAERRALESRIADLTLRAAMPGSPLACLTSGAGEAVEAACEKTLFASPESVAAALAYAELRLTLLADAADHAARGGDAAQALAALRRPVEADRFGFFAHAFSLREGCAAEGCDAAELVLADASRILANLKEGTYQSHVGRYAIAWGQPAGPALASAPATPAAGPTVVTSANFPTAESIPPVSIMNNEPGMPGQNGMDGAAPRAEPAAKESTKPASPPRRAPPARRAAEAPGAPIPIAPPRPAAAPAPVAPAQ
jgi:hypothetical protein